MPSLVDDTVLNELRETLGPSVSRIVDKYIQQVPVYLADLNEAVQKKNEELFKRTAHSLKSASRSMGAVVAGEMAADLEQKGLAGASMIDDLRECLDSTVVLLRDWSKDVAA